MQDDLLPTRRSLLGRLADWEDQDSWRDFFDTYWRLIYSTALRAGLTETEAEDVVQETVVAVAKAMHDFKYDPARCAFKTWLRVLCNRRIADHFRKRARQVESREEAREDLLESLPDPASLEPDPQWDEDWEQNLLRAAKERVKEQVAAQTYQVYDYHVLQEQSVRDTCKALGVNAAQVYLAKHRVGRLLQKQVEELRSKCG